MNFCLDLNLIESLTGSSSNDKEFGSKSFKENVDELEIVLQNASTLNFLKIDNSGNLVEPLAPEIVSGQGISERDLQNSDSRFAWRLRYSRRTVSPRHSMAPTKTIESL